jgi:hypothetical protein
MPIYDDDASGYDTPSNQVLRIGRKKVGGKKKKGGCAGCGKKCGGGCGHPSCSCGGSDGVIKKGVKFDPKLAKEVKRRGRIKDDFKTPPSRGRRGERGYEITEWVKRDAPILHQAGDTPMKMSRREREAMMKGLMALGQPKTSPQDINKFMTQGLQVVTGTKPTVDTGAYGGPLGSKWVGVTEENYVPNQTQIRTGPRADTDPYPCGTPAMYGTYLCDDEFEHRLDERAMTQGRDLSDSLATRALQSGDYQPFFDDWMSRFGPQPPPLRKGKERKPPPEPDVPLEPPVVGIPVQPQPMSDEEFRRLMTQMIPLDQPPTPPPFVDFEELADQMGEMGRPAPRGPNCPAQDVDPRTLSSCSRRHLSLIHPDLNSDCVDLATRMTQIFNASCEAQKGERSLQRDPDPDPYSELPFTGSDVSVDEPLPPLQRLPSGVLAPDPFSELPFMGSDVSVASSLPPLQTLPSGLLASPEELEEMDLPFQPFEPDPNAPLQSFEPEVPLGKRLNTQGLIERAVELFGTKEQGGDLVYDRDNMSAEEFVRRNKAWLDKVMTARGRPVTQKKDGTLSTAYANIIAEMLKAVMGDKDADKEGWVAGREPEPQRKKKGKGRSGGMNQDNQDPNAPPPIILRRQPGPPLNWQQILNVLDQGQYRNNDPSVFTDRMSPRGVRRAITERRVAGEVLGDRLTEEAMRNLYDFI